ncbi:TetR/AcrR family transcriptional regulator [Candidatus Chloroploca sp. Khr17]|uniref:TetR/AcrR family transcriptional regulator n=1 Tax=Candidatus Chloroploca sp. Khr17 TaxID=2496869 RepID=UPI00101C9CB5|nr:TetR/AcrR family transcriptional regulator [Candidatus Chloroploca sp. Khr17]
MPPRDQDEFEQRRRQILDGALEVFAAKGFEKATNKDIATAAGINSPGLIYHYFADKADLFRHVVQHFVPMISLLDHPDDLMQRPAREVLTLFAATVLKATENRQLFAAYKLVVSEAFRRPAIAELVNKIGPQRGVRFLWLYLAQEIASGRMRQIDPGIAVRLFIGPLLAFVIMRELFPQPDAATISAETMVEQTVEAFLRTMAV